MMSQKHIMMPFLFHDFIIHSCSKYKGSLVPRPSLSPIFDHLCILYETGGGERLETRVYEDL